jgi:transcriptional regulator with GAF, ATPase, and Fis domain
MPLSMQAKLLRVLQEKEIERLGAEKTISVDVRIISATNKDLCDLVREGAFREDLYYRINVINFHIPPLGIERKISLSWSIMLLRN